MPKVVSETLRSSDGAWGDSCVISCEATLPAIQKAIGSVKGRFQPDILPGTGHTSELIVKHLKDYFHEL